MKRSSSTPNRSLAVHDQLDRDATRMVIRRGPGRRSERSGYARDETVPCLDKGTRSNEHRSTQRPKSQRQYRGGPGPARQHGRPSRPGLVTVPTCTFWLAASGRSHTPTAGRAVRSSSTLRPAMLSRRRHVFCKGAMSTIDGCQRTSRSPVGRTADLRLCGHEFSGWAVTRFPGGWSVQWDDPLPARASARRWLSPLVVIRWAWCSSRSTVAVARVLGMIVSKPEGWMLLVTAIERRS